MAGPLRGGGGKGRPYGEKKSRIFTTEREREREYGKRYRERRIYYA